MTFNDEEFAHQRVTRISEAVLRDAGVIGVFPTPLDEVAEAAGIVETLDINQLPDAPDFKAPKALGRILGALHFGSRTAFVDGGQIEGRVRWTRGHEITHNVVPWHRTSLLFDDEERLFRRVEEQREREANIGAAHLLFQGGRFFENALSYETSIKTPILLAEDFGASMHATIWYYVEHHPGEVALAVAGLHRRASGHVPVFRTVESRPFRTRFGSLGSHLSPAGLPVTDGAGDDSLAVAARKARMASGTAETELQLFGADGVPVTVRAEMFCNQRCLFLLVTPKKLMRLGKRIKVASA